MSGDYATYSSPLDGVAIRSYFTASEGDGTAPPVVILRGVAGPDDGYIAIADRLAEAGYAALVHSWQVRGNDPADAVLIADVKGALGFLAGRAEVAPGKVAVFGYCKGGGQALLVAAACDEIGAVVAFHGFARRPREGADAEHRNPIDAVGRVRCPVLLLHGEDDQLSPLAAMRELDAALRGAGVEAAMHTYAGADHGFAVSTHQGYQKAAADDGFAKAIAFLERTLKQS